MMEISFLNCFALKPLLSTCCYTLSPITSHPNFSFMPFLFLCVHTQVDFPQKVHKLTETTPPWSWVTNNTQPHHPPPSPAPTRAGSAPSYQLVPSASSSLMFLLGCTHSDKLQREPHPPVTLHLLLFTSQAHTAPHKNSTVTQAVCRKYPAQAAKALHPLFLPVAQQTHEERKGKHSYTLSSVKTDI